MNHPVIAGDMSGRTEGDQDGMSLAEMAYALRKQIVLITLGSMAAGLVGLGVATLIPPTFTATTTFLPPQQAQGNTASALASLGSLAGLAGGAGGISNPSERYVALMQSVTLSDRIVEQFKLMGVYDTKLRVDARKELASNVRIGLGKKEGLITLEVDDKSPQRAADIANRYVDELRRMTGTLTMTEAQQRRAFFERQLQQSRDRLIPAQLALQSSGFNAAALKAEPKAAAEAYAKLKAETTAADTRLQILRGTMAEGTTEVRQQQTALGALRQQLALAERASDSAGGADYVGRYREFKYQETLFELYARQYEMARADESREGALIQVVDPATPPEKKSKPNRAMVALATSFGAMMILSTFAVMRHWGRRLKPKDVGQ